MDQRCFKIDKDPDDVVCAFIDKYITAVRPPVTSENEHHIKLTDSLQKHTHSDYCYKNKSCLFGFPNAKSLLQTVQNTLTTANVQNKCTEQFLQDMNLY